MSNLREKNQEWFEVLEAKVAEVFPKEAQIKPLHRGSLKQPQKPKRRLKTKP